MQSLAWISAKTLNRYPCFYPCPSEVCCQHSNKYETDPVLPPFKTPPFTQRKHQSSQSPKWSNCLPINLFDYCCYCSAPLSLRSTLGITLRCLPMAPFLTVYDPPNLDEFISNPTQNLTCTLKHQVSVWFSAFLCISVDYNKFLEGRDIYS